MHTDSGGTVNTVGAMGAMGDGVVFTRRQTGQPRVCVRARADMLALVDRDFAAASVFLGDKPFLTGDRPTEGDAALYGLLETTLYQPRDIPLVGLVRKYDNLVSFAHRVRNTYFPDQVADPAVQVFAKRK